MTDQEAVEFLVRHKFLAEPASQFSDEKIQRHPSLRRIVGLTVKAYEAGLVAGVNAGLPHPGSER